MVLIKVGRMKLNSLTEVVLLLNVSARLGSVKPYSSTILNLALKKENTISAEAIITGRIILRAIDAVSLNTYIHLIPSF